MEIKVATSANLMDVWAALVTYRADNILSGRTTCPKTYPTFQLSSKVKKKVCCCVNSTYLTFKQAHAPFCHLTHPFP